MLPLTPLLFAAATAAPTLRAERTDENWIGKAQKTPGGWSAELKIPLRILRFEEKELQSFGLQVRRYTSARKETDEWAHIPRADSGEVSRYGRLSNLVRLKKGASVEVRPFVLGKVASRDTEDAPLSRGFSPGFSAGADFKWLVLPSLTLDGAINPDFGQVEADKVVLNLSSYETYLPEKRPFFLEAADVFSTPLQLVYTRRIGRAAYVPELPDGEEVRATPDPSPIYGALKMTGTVGEKWSVGALLAGKLLLRKDGGGHMRGEITYQIHGKNTDYNDLGFMQRQNQHSIDGYAEYDTNGPFGRFNDGFLGVYAFENETLELVSTGRGGGLFMGAQFKNFWRSFFEVNVRGDYLDDREVGDGAALERAGSAAVEGSVSTDTRAPVSASVYVVLRGFTNEAVSVYVDGYLKAQVLPQLELELTPNFTYTKGEPRYYDETDNAYLFARLEAASLSATLSATYTFLPTLTLQVYGQAFMAFGRYTGDSSFARTGEARPRILLSALVPTARPAGEEPDFADGSFNTNVVARWEYRLGSTVYLVYSHAQSDGKTPVFNEAGKLDFRLIGPRPAADVFLLKASYWWG